MFYTLVKSGVIKFLLWRFLDVSYFGLEVVDCEVDALDSIVDEGAFSFSDYGLFKAISISFDLQGFCCDIIA